MSDSTLEPTHMAFAGQTCVASGTLPQVALCLKEVLDQDPGISPLVLDYHTSQVVDLDLRGTVDDVGARLAAAPADSKAHPLDADDTASPAAADSKVAEPRTPGRPKLGVVAREVTLLPRHWEWLNEQPGGASVTLRKLVEEARRSTSGEVRKRKAKEACYRFMSILAGNEPGYEEALRALYAGDSERYRELTEHWPPDVRDHAQRLAAGAF